MPLLHAGRTGEQGDKGNKMSKDAYDHITTEERKMDVQMEQEMRMPRKANQKRHAIELWKRIINHYKSDKTIAAFELMNENYGGVLGTEFLYRKLRSVDPSRMLLLWELPQPVCTGWKRVMFGPHLYDVRGQDDERVIEESIAKYKGDADSYGFPLFVGELHVFGEEMQARKSLQYLLRRLNEENIGWAVWTWKGWDVGDWAFERIGCGRRVDIANDSAEQIAMCWKHLSKEATSNQGLVNAVKPHL